MKMGNFVEKRTLVVQYTKGGDNNHHHDGKANWFHMGLCPRDPSNHLFICIKTKEAGPGKGQLCAQTMIEPHGGRVHFGAKDCTTCETFPLDAAAPRVSLGGGAIVS